LHYQPKIDINAGRIVGVEALIRWRHPKRGMVPPGLFIGVAEETGLIVPIGEWVLETACRQMAAWRQADLPEITVAVNLASPSFRSGLLVSDIATVLRTFNLRPELLELEVTETMLMQDADATIRTLAQLHELGVKLAIDDFGTGHSSLSYLRRFRVDQLKIDRSFIAEMTDSPADAAITAAIVLFSQKLNLQVVAEGVETAAQATMLRQLGCHLLQGYYFSKPVEPEKLAELMGQKFTISN
jgi:diguanylate cyclase